MAPPRYTPEDLLTMPDGDRYELVDGKLVEQIVSMWSSYVSGQILCAIQDYCETNPAGWVFPGGLCYQCFPDAPDNVRKPLVSFVRLERMSTAQLMAPGHCRVAPDLTVEVMSPNDVVCDIEEKMAAFLRAGASLIWDVNPVTRTVQVHRADGSVNQFREEQEITGEDVLPGFRCRVGDFFKLPPGIMRNP